MLMAKGSRTLDVVAARGMQLCILQLAREARSMGLIFAAAHLDVAALEIADSVGDVTRELSVQLSVANDDTLARDGLGHNGQMGNRQEQG
jgi:hypothetical protein